jgi:chloramphenicol 3-O phosphotransferase
MSIAHHTIKYFADMGVNTIVEHVLFPSIEIQPYKDLAKECIELLYEYPVLFVHVICPLEELRRREKGRGDRDIGRAEIQLPHLNPQDTYDTVVDTYSLSVEECTDKIIEKLNTSDKFTAFKSFWTPMQSKTV